MTRTRQTDNLNSRGEKIGGCPIEDVTDPYRHNRRGSASITEAYPDVAAEWYYQNNCGFGPEDFSYGSKVNAWWQCSRNSEHIWRTQVLTRCCKGRNCPQCFGTKLVGLDVTERSLATNFPEIAREWHPTKNGKLNPNEILSHSKKHVWWRCSQNKSHEWKAEIKARTGLNSGCPHCYDDGIDLADYPEALMMFDRKRNRGLDPHHLPVTALVCWKCPKGPDHIWCRDFVRKKISCPHCSGRIVSKTNSLPALFPEIASEVHPTKNGSLSLNEVGAHSKQKLWWQCLVDPSHVWPATVRNRTCNKSGCPECWQENRKQILRLARERLKEEKRKRGELTLTERLTPKIICLHEQGLSIAEISRKLDFNGSVNKFVSKVES